MNIDQIAICYISMDSSQQALQSNGKFFFSNFELASFWNFGKSVKYSKELWVVNIDQIAIRYMSMDSSQRDLQTCRKLFSNFEFVFKFLAKNRKFFKRIVMREYWSNCNVLYINGLVSTSSTK